MKVAKGWSSFAGLALVAGHFGVGDMALAQTYRVTELGTLGGSTSTVYGINSSGQAVGSSTTAGDANTHAFLYDNGKMTDLGTLGGATSEAFAINDAGAVVGYSSTASLTNHATIWNSGSASDLDSGDTSSSYAYAINNVGQIVGAVGGVRNPAPNYAACDNGMATIWIGGIGTALPPLNPGAHSVAYAINDSGQIAGCAESLVNGTFYGATWTNGVITQLGVFAGNAGAAFAVNSAGLIVGEANDGAFDEATLWSGITPQGLAGFAPSHAYAINAAEQMVGTDDMTDATNGNRATLWLSAGTVNTDLNSAISPQDGLANTLLDAVAINATGSIVANGVVNATGEKHAYLLTPLVGPPTATLSASPSSVMVGQSITLSWSSTEAWSCVAGGSVPSGSSWSGQQATSGSVVVMAGSVPGTFVFTLTCELGKQSVKAQAIVTVTEPSPPASSGGGGALDWLSLASLFLIRGGRRIMRCGVALGRP
jgi:probable HAF family extracellular repeat protein